MRIKTSRITTNYELSGPKNPAVVMLSHSLGSNLHMWDPQLTALEAIFRVLRYDTRGHGASDVPDGAYTLDQLVADAVALLDALGIPKVNFVGLSMGGMIAQVTPDATNWDNITNGTGQQNPVEIISGIDQSIYLRADISGFSRYPVATACYLYASTAAGSLLGASYVSNSVQMEFGPIPNNTDVYFVALGENWKAWSWTCSVTVKYKSVDGGSYDSTLDTFTISISGAGDGLGDLR